MAMLDDSLQELGGSQGLQDLTQKLTQRGRDRRVQSWIGHGGNRPVSGQQIIQALGEHRLEEVASQVDASPQEISDQLARDLQQYVDRAMPEGQRRAG